MLQCVSPSLDKPVKKNLAPLNSERNRGHLIGNLIANMQPTAKVLPNFGSAPLVRLYLRVRMIRKGKNRQSQLNSRISREQIIALHSLLSRNYLGIMNHEIPNTKLMR